MRTSVWVAVYCPPTGRVLVARRAQWIHNGGLWNFLGGGVDPHEEVRAAASRELWEEGGLHIEPDDLLVLGESVLGEKCDVLAAIAVGHEVRPRLNAESDAWRWVPYPMIDVGELHSATARLAPLAWPFVRAVAPRFTVATMRRSA